MEQPLSASSRHAMTRAADKLLLAMWVLSYAVIVQVFRTLRKFESKR
jgi:hypothetical protein